MSPGWDSSPPQGTTHIHIPRMLTHSLTLLSIASPSPGNFLVTTGGHGVEHEALVEVFP